MKIWILSDLHLEYAKLRQPLEIPDADICVVAGDLMRNPSKGVEWLEEHIALSMPCVYVAGNHEFYRGYLNDWIQEGKAASLQHADVHYLENESVIIDGVRFVGATLWTDYSIMGSREFGVMHAKANMNDYKMISLQKQPWKRLFPEFLYRRHQESRRFIEQALTEEAELPTVVVTHHLPSAKSLHQRSKTDLLNSAYASDLEDLILSGKPVAWFHGHVHDSNDYEIGDTRIISNPRGYEDENKNFDPGLVVEIDLSPRPSMGGGR